MARTPRPELVPFIELNAEEKASKQKLPWKRADLITAHFPQAAKMDWHVAFRDPDLWGRFLKDIHGGDKNESPQRARERLRQITGNDYSYDPFNIAFKTLAGSRSVRHLATKLNLSTQITWKLRKGIKAPDLELIEKIAEAFGKHPSYFVEYRIAYILGALGDQMEMAPEISVDLYRKLRKQRAA
jgi:transcriptional regulator with XRE-family HTH domain